MHGVRRILSPGACLLQRIAETRMDIRAEQLSRRTTDPLTRRDYLMHTDIHDVCENPPCQECALKNTCGSTIATTLRAIATRPPRGLRPLPDPNAVGDGTDGPGDGGYGPPRVSKVQSSPHP